MKKYLHIPISFDTFVLDSQEVVRVHVAPESLRDFTLCLALLLQGWVQSVVFGTKSGNLEFHVGPAVGYQRSPGPKLVVTLTATALDFATAYFMRYYRDGVAEVDHIDLEAPDGGYITFMVDEAVPPLDAAEAKRRLGLT